MKLRHTNQIELSVANLKALVAEVERKQAEGKPVDALIFAVRDGEALSVSVVADEDHYSDEELSRRRNPYLAPEAWAGVL